MVCDEAIAETLRPVLGRVVPQQSCFAPPRSAGAAVCNRQQEEEQSMTQIHAIDAGMFDLDPQTKEMARC